MIVAMTIRIICGEPIGNHLWTRPAKRMLCTNMREKKMSWSPVKKLNPRSKLTFITFLNLLESGSHNSVKIFLLCFVRSIGLFMFEQCVHIFLFDDKSQDSHSTWKTWKYGILKNLINIMEKWYITWKSWWLLRIHPWLPQNNTKFTKLLK